LQFIFIRVNQPVIKHVVLRAGQIQGEGFVVFGAQTKLEPLLLVHLAHYKSSKMK
jgi:hypothetical protein